MKLLVIDDHLLFARGVALLVEQGLGWAVTLVGSVEAALPRLDEGFDAVLLDLDLPGISGLEGLARLQSGAAALPVVVCSSHSGELARAASLERGARAYINKADPPERLLNVLAQALRPPSAASTGERAAPASTLTARQREVLLLLADGKSNKVIARALDMSENTVRNHVAATLDRLGVQNRHEAAVAARRLGLL